MDRNFVWSILWMDEGLYRNYSKTCDGFLTSLRYSSSRVGMRGIKKCPPMIYRLKKYRDTGISR